MYDLTLDMIYNDLLDYICVLYYQDVFSECDLPFKKQHLKSYKYSFSHIDLDHCYVTIQHRNVVIKFSKCSFQINPERVLVTDQMHFKTIYFIHGSGTLHDNDFGWKERHVPD